MQILHELRRFTRIVYHVFVADAHAEGLSLLNEGAEPVGVFAVRNCFFAARAVEIEEPCTEGGGSFKVFFEKLKAVVKAAAV